MSSKSKNEEKITYVIIFIHEEKQMSEIKDNTLSKSSGIVRVRGFLKKDKAWTTLAYKIPISNLGLGEDSDKKEILDRILNPYQIINKEIKSLLDKLLDQYGPIRAKGRDKLEYKTERFKKKWKQKTRRVGGV